MKHIQRYLPDIGGVKPQTREETEQQLWVKPRKIPWKEVLNPPFLVGSAVLIFLVAIVWFGPLMASYDPYLTSRLAPPVFNPDQMTLVRPPFKPGPAYLLGSDKFGNDLLSLLLYGARTTLVTCLYITFGKALLGLILGSLSGWKAGSLLDRLVTSLSGVISSSPLLLNALLMILALGVKHGLWVFVLTLTILGWTEIAQTIRGETIRIRGMLYIEAAEALGMTPLQVFTRHALPNLISQLLSTSFLEMGTTLLILAELGFLQVFVGGSDWFLQDPFAGMELIPRIPEWGNLIAQGTPYLRSYPHIILGAAGAFLIAILGINAFGEGIRQLFERWPISTSFLLKKEMLLLAALFIGVSALIFKHTSPQVSYQSVAQALSRDRLESQLEELEAINARPGGTAGQQVAAYIIDEFQRNQVKKGWAQQVNSRYDFPATATLVKPRRDPALRVGPDRFQFGDEFTFRNESCAGSGSARSPVFFLDGPIPLDRASLSGVPLGGKIVLIREQQAGPSFWTTARELGVQGVLVASAGDSLPGSQYELPADMQSDGCPGGTLPVFNISQGAARRITAQAHLDWSRLPDQPDGKLSLIDLHTEGTMDLDLAPPQNVDVPNAIGFLGGFDFQAASELVVIYTTFDGLGLSNAGDGRIPPADLAKIALLLEIMRTWNDNNLDPRRSIQFVIWGGEGTQESYFRLLSGILITNKLAAEVPTGGGVKPAIWIEIGQLGLDANQLALSSQSTEYLKQIAEQAADQAHARLQIGDPDVPWVNSGLPQLLIGEPPGPIGQEAADLDAYLKKGVLINRTLIQLARDTSTTVKGERLIKR